MPKQAVVRILEWVANWETRVDPIEGCSVEANGVFAMSWMSRDIRRYAIGHPILWAQILRVDSDSVECFKTLLARSQQSTICLFTSSRDRAVPLTPEREEVWALAVENAWRCVYLSFDDTDIERHLPLQHLLSSPLPMLKQVSKFRLSGIIPEWNSHSRSPISEGRRLLYRAAHTKSQSRMVETLAAPLIRTVRLSGHFSRFPVPEPQYSKITVFSIDNMSPNSVNQPGWTLQHLWYMLHLLPALEELSIIDTVLIPRLLTLPQCAPCRKVVSLPHLRQLTISAHFALFREVVDLLKFPSTASIDIKFTTAPRPLWMDKQLRLNSGFVAETLHEVYLLFPSDRHYTYARLELSPTRISHSVSTDSKPLSTYSFTLDANNCGLEDDELEDFLDTRVIGFQKSFSLFRVEHLSLDFCMPQFRKAVDSLRAALAEMKRVTSIRTNPMSFQELVGLSIDRSWSSYDILFPSLTQIYIDHRMIHSLSTWSCLCLYMVWRAMNNLPSISSIIIEDVRETEDEGVAGICASFKEKLPRFFTLQVHLTRDKLIYASYSM